MRQSGQPQTIDMGASMETEEGLAIIDALNEVSDVQAMAGSQVTFLGERLASIGPVGPYEGADVFRCPRGWFVLLRVPGGPHAPAAGDDWESALAAVEDDGIRASIARQLADRELG